MLSAAFNTGCTVMLGLSSCCRTACCCWVAAADADSAAVHSEMVSWHTHHADEVPCCLQTVKATRTEQQQRDVGYDNRDGVRQAAPISARPASSVCHLALLSSLASQLQLLLPSWVVVKVAG